MHLLNELIVIRGAPGIGKSTLGLLLKKSGLFKKVVDIDEMREMINGEHFAYGENVHYFNAIDVACELFDLFVKQGEFPVAVLDVCSEPILNRIISNMKGVRVLVVSLYSSDEILVQRMTNRNGGFVAVEIAKKLNKEMYNFGHIFIDTTNLDHKGVCSKLQHELHDRLATSSII